MSKAQSPALTGDFTSGLDETIGLSIDVGELISAHELSRDGEMPCVDELDDVSRGLYKPLTTAAQKRTGVIFGIDILLNLFERLYIPSPHKA
jgi:hypothetical protein